MYLAHYLDDILIAEQNDKEIIKCYIELKQALQNKGLEVVLVEVQLKDPYIERV